MHFNVHGAVKWASERHTLGWYLCCIVQLQGISFIQKEPLSGIYTYELKMHLTLKTLHVGNTDNRQKILHT
jgi:hypothetical protein